MKTYKIWMEGYCITRNNSKATKIGEIKAKSFLEACRKLCGTRDDYKEETLLHNTKTLEFYKKTKDPYIWGCKLYDNEKEARRSFG